MTMISLLSNCMLITMYCYYNKQVFRCHFALFAKHAVDPFLSAELLHNLVLKSALKGSWC